MQIRAEPEKSALSICNYSQILYQFFKFTQNLKQSLQIPEQEICKTLLTLSEDGVIIAKPRSPHKDFSLYWEITIKSECLEYFTNKKQAKIANKRDWIKTYIPIIISSLSLVISIAALVISIIKLSKGM